MGLFMPTLELPWVEVKGTLKTVMLFHNDIIRLTFRKDSFLTVSSPCS